MKRFLILIGIIVAVLFTSCKKDTSVTNESSGKEEPQVDTANYFYFEAVEAGATIEMGKHDDGYGTPPEISLEYSTDKSNWLSFIVGQTSITLDSVGAKVYIRARERNGSFCNYSVWQNYNYFIASKFVKVGGNIMYLLDGTINWADCITVGHLSRGMFYGLFGNMTSLTDASALVLQATELSYECYSCMFYGCTSLTKAPELPATTLGEECYKCMFYGCTSLSKAPDLHAIQLGEECCRSMFQGCTLLTEIPKLPATELAKCCYYEMFKDCSSLTRATEIKATTLAVGSLGYMFQGCTSLQDIDVSFTEWYVTDKGESWLAANDWLTGASSSGTFKCPEELDTSMRDEHHIPEGWTIVTK